MKYVGGVRTLPALSVVQVFGHVSCQADKFTLLMVVTGHHSQSVGHLDNILYEPEQFSVASQG